jgi:hypothetical protein
MGEREIAGRRVKKNAVRLFMWVEDMEAQLGMAVSDIAEENTQKHTKKEKELAE